MSVCLSVMLQSFAIYECFHPCFKYKNWYEHSSWGEEEFKPEMIHENETQTIDIKFTYLWTIGITLKDYRTCR